MKDVALARRDAGVSDDGGPGTDMVVHENGVARQYSGVPEDGVAQPYVGVQDVGGTRRNAGHDRDPGGVGELRELV